jgi:hypothetical protein
MAAKNAADYTCSITVNISPEKALEMISQVQDWWTKDLKGSTQELNDEFTVSFGTTWKTFRITELTPGAKLVWQVVDCNMPWNKDVKEWANSRIEWAVSAANGGTRITFTHYDLAIMYCGEVCMNAWSDYIQNNLHSYCNR